MKTVYVSDKNDNRLTHIDTRTQFLSEMGFEPIMRRGHCSCGRSDCLCLNDPFSTAEKHNVKLDIGDKYDPWNYLFIANESYSRPPEHVINRETRSWEPGTRPNDDRSNSLNPNNTAHSAGMENRANQLNFNNPGYRGKLPRV